MATAQRVATAHTVASAWSPLNLPNLLAWYDFSDTATITASSGAVSQVTDKSGNARTLTQATGANQPLTGTDTINGRNVLKCDGANDYLASGNVTQSQPLTVLAVLKTTDTGSTARQAFMAATEDYCVVYQKAGQWAMFASGTELLGGTINTNAHQLVWIYNGASSVGYVDGTSTITGNPGTQGFNTKPINVGSFGGSTPWQGDIAEVVLMGSAITSTDRTSWNTYCARWGL